MSDAAVPALRDSGTLDDVLLAMDVVDTLRHREKLVLTELDAGAREAALLDRLQEVYAAQGIDVPDHILREGVRALEEKRFVYSPPKPSLGLSLAKLYVTRGRWLAPAMLALLLAAILFGIYRFGFVAPARANDARAQIEMTQTLPEALTRLHAQVTGIALDESVVLRANAWQTRGQRALAAGDVTGARSAREGLEQLKQDVESQYEVRVVYGPGEPRSGIFRVPDDVPGGRNFYLVVEAVDPLGNLIEAEILSEEDGKVARVSRWGQRVSQSVFDRVAADKADDQIIQDAVIGRKPAGYLYPHYTVETPGGAILEW